MSSQSPLKAPPLPLPGESLDIKLSGWRSDRLFEPLFVAASFCLLAYMEWLGYLTHAPRRPVLFSILAMASVLFAAWRISIIRKHIKRIKLGRDGERVVGQFLERLRNGGAQVFHDIPAQGFNLDHVVISPHGLYAIETKTFRKPRPKDVVTVEGDTLLVAGYPPHRNPIEQVSSAAHWLECLLQQSTGKRYVVRGVVVFPGWFVEQRPPRGRVWVLEPKALPAFIEREPATVDPADVALAAFHLSRYVMSEVDQQPR
jgi:hypothetical protein